MYIYINENVKIIKSYIGANIVYCVDGDMYTFNINKEGLYIFLMCDGSKTVEDIIGAIIKKYDAVNEDDIKEISSDTYEFINEYLSKGILRYKEVQGISKVEEYGNEDLVIPDRISLELTNKCQLKCKHCFNMSGKERENEIDINSFIDISRKFSELGTQSIFLTGGEAFLKKDIKKLIEYTTNNFKEVTIASNGYFIADDLIETLRTYTNIRIQISIDGINEVHDNIRGVSGAFNKSVESIKKLCEYNIPVTIAFTMNDKNVEQLEDVIIMSKDLGCFGINVSATADTGRAKENNMGGTIKDFSEIVSILGDKYRNDNFYISKEFEENEIESMQESIQYLNKCGAGYKIMHVMSDGNLTLCPSISSIILGNFKDDISDVLSYKNIERIMNIPTPNKKLCGDCKNYEKCGKCIANMLEQNVEECVILSGFKI